MAKKSRNAGGRRKGKTPIILLTARGEEIDKVLGLELGADDYVTKPFSVRELLARIKAILRRSEGQSNQTDKGQVTIGRLTVDFQSYVAIENGDEIKLSHKEFEILHYLLDHSNLVVSRYDLLEDIWGYDEQPTTRTVDNYILSIRKKIEDDPSNPKHLITVHKAGYKFVK